MFDRPWLEPEGEVPTGSAGLFDDGPTSADQDVIERIQRIEAGQRAVAGDVATLGTWAKGTALAESLGSEVFGQEVFRRASFAQGLVAVHHLVTELLAQDRDQVGCERGEAMEYAVHDVAAALGVSRRTAEIRIEDASLLVRDQPRTLAVLRAGYLPEAAARELAHRLAGQPQPLRAAVERSVLDTLGAPADLALGSDDVEELGLTARLEPGRAATVSLGATRGRVRDLVARALRDLAPQHAEDAEEPEPVVGADLAAAERPTPSSRLGDVKAWQTRPGFVFVGREFTESDATVVLDRNDHLARTSKRSGDPRSLAELRGTWFRDLLLAEAGGLPVPGHAPGAGPTDDDGCPGLRPVPVHLLDDRTTVDADRLGPVSPGTLARLMAAAQATRGRVSVRRVGMPECPGHTITDGTVTDPGPYVVPPRLREAIQARDRTCRFPGCTVPARSCDLDHSIPHPRGPTCSCNIGCLCRTHHRLKTSRRWRLTNHGGGRFTWTSPTGRTFEVRPDPT